MKSIIKKNKYHFYIEKHNKIHSIYYNYSYDYYGCQDSTHGYQEGFWHNKRQKSRFQSKVHHYYTKYKNVYYCFNGKDVDL
jgi:hypothetical protein